MRAIKSFDTILFVSSCLQISEIPVTIKGRISYHNESNQKSCPHSFLSSHVLMKTHCEPKINVWFVSRNPSQRSNSNDYTSQLIKIGFFLK